MEIKTSSTLPFNGKVTLKDFISEMKSFDSISSLMSIQKLGVLMGNQVWVNINLEFEFYASQKVRHQILLPKDFLSFFAKQTLLYCSKSNKKYSDLELASLVYRYANLETDLDYLDPKSEDAWLWVLRATNHQWFYLRLSSGIMGRYLFLFFEVLKQDEDLKMNVNSVLGIDIFDLFKIGTCIFANFALRAEGQATYFDKKLFINTILVNLLTEKNLDKFLHIFSISQTDFIKKNKEFAIKDKLLKKYEFNPLRRFPVIKTDSENEREKYIIPSIPDFIYSCFEGMYYILLDKLDDSNKQKLFQGFGSVFEKYIGQLIKYYNVDLFSRAKLIPEQEYKEGKNIVKSADWILVSEKYIFQIECKKRKLDNYSKVGLEDKNKKGINSLLSDIAKELDKLIRKEKHIKENKLISVKYQNQQVVNIIVFLDEMFAMNTYARKSIKDKMKEESDNFYILGCHEFEMLCQHSKDKSLNMFEALNDLIKNRTEIYSISFLDNIYNDFFNDLKGHS